MTRPKSKIVLVNSYGPMGSTVLASIIEKLSQAQSEIFKSLHELGIGVNLHYIPVHLHPYYQDYGFKAGLKEHADRFLQDFGDVKTDPRILAELEKSISKLASHGVRVTVITNPLHASRLYLIEQNQLQPHLLELIQKLNRMTKKINSDDQSQVEFWHFAHCDSNNFEPIPHNPDDHMQYFYDANHFTPTLGMDIAKQSFLRHQYVNY